MQSQNKHNYNKNYIAISWKCGYYNGGKRLCGTTEVSLTEYSVILKGIFNSKSHENLIVIVITTSIVYLNNGK